MKKKISWFELITIVCIIVIFVNILNYKENFKILFRDGSDYIKLCYDEIFRSTYIKFKYVSEMDPLLMKQDDLICSYTDLIYEVKNETNYKENLKDDLMELIIEFRDNKKKIEIIKPPRFFINDHNDIIKACQYCTDSIDIYFKAINIENKELRSEKIEEAKDKIMEYRKYRSYLKHKYYRPGLH